MLAALLSAATAVLAFLMAAALLDQWRERRGPYQLAWAIGSLLFGVASAAEAIGAAGGWSAELFKVWYLAGAVLNAAWLGLGTAFLLGKTRFGYAYAALAGARWRVHDAEPGEEPLRGRRLAADPVPDLRPRARARDRGRDVLPEHALAADRGRRRRGDHGPRRRSWSSIAPLPAARSRSTSTACRSWTRCPAASACSPR